MTRDTSYSYCKQQQVTTRTLLTFLRRRQQLELDYTKGLLVLSNEMKEFFERLQEKQENPPAPKKRARSRSFFTKAKQNERFKKKKKKKI